MKSNKKRLLRSKRLLAMLLAVTMAVCMLPSSVVYAGELPQTDTETVANTPVEGDPAKEEDVTDGGDAVDVTEEKGADGDVANGEGTDSGDTDGVAESDKDADKSDVSEETQTGDEDADKSNVSEETQTGDKDADKSDVSEETQTGDKDADKSDVSEETQTGDNGTGMKVNAEGAARAVEYTLVTDEYQEELALEGCDMDKAEYGFWGIPYWSDPECINLIRVRMAEGENVSDLSLGEIESSESFSYSTQWSVEQNGAWVPLSEAPNKKTGVGKYKLTITLNAKGETTTKLKDFELTYEITKATLVTDAEISDVTPGTAAADVKVSNATLKTAWDEEIFSYGSAEATPKLSFAVTVKDVDNAKGEAPAKLLKSGNYMAEVTPSFTAQVPAEEQANYILQPATVRINMAGLVGTTVEPKRVDGDKWKDTENSTAEAPVYNNYITVEYSGEKIEDPVTPADFTYTVKYDSVAADGSVTQKEFTAAELDKKVTFGWYDGTGDKELAEKPEKAGTYYYRISYEGEAGLYAPSYADIEVRIVPKTLTLKPKVKNDKVVYYKGMTVKEVLSNIDYDALGKDGNVVKIDRDHIWGTYSNKGITLSYEPVFKLQVQQQLAEGETLPEGQELGFDDCNDSATLEFGRTYRVVFSGEKAVYYAHGGQKRQVSINTTATDPNYTVDYSDAAVKKDALAVTVTDAEKVTIDVSEITLAGASEGNDGKTAEKPFDKVYDSKALYDTRAGYKKAKVTTGSKTIAGTDASFTYTWERYENWWGNYDGEIYEADSGDWYPYEDNSLPESAGIYRLVISYTDPNRQYYAEDATVYYQIKKRKVKIVPTETPIAFAGNSTSEYADDEQGEIKYEIQDPETGKPDTLIQQSGYDVYDLNWQVEMESATAGTYEAAGSTFDIAKKYRVSVPEGGFYDYSGNYADYEWVLPTGAADGTPMVKKYLNGTCDVTVKNLGTTPLALTISTDKSPYTYNGKAVDLAEIVKLPEGVKLEHDLVYSLRCSYHTYEYEVLSYDEVQVEWKDLVGWSDEAVDAGHYELYVSYPGDETYAPLEAAVQPNAEFDILPARLEVTMNVTEPVVAGEWTYDLDYTLDIKGAAERDQQEFKYQYYSYYDSFNDRYGWRYGYPAFQWGIYNAEINQDVWGYWDVWTPYGLKDANGQYYHNDVLKSGNYTMVYGGLLKPQHERNYEVYYKQTQFTVGRGTSTVRAESTDEIGSAEVTDSISGLKHVITPVEAVKFSDSSYMYDIDDNKLPYGNYIAVRIDMPMEYYGNYANVLKNAIYKNNIEKAGGYLLEEDTYDDYEDSYGYIVVAFEASAKDQKKFSILWEEGYTEEFTLDFRNAALEADLRDAVGPKSIAFNAPNRKMVVGDVQALDVKLTKKQQADIIALRYSVDEAGKSVLHIDEETGKITALKTGNATVTVYPVHKNNEGRLVPITERGVKTAKVTISVGQVSKPKISKVTVDKDAGGKAKVKVGSSEVKDGWRREIYVLKGKATEKDFTDKIAAMTNQNWQGLFEIAPIYRTDLNYEDEVKKKNGYYPVSGLEHNTEYTVYVRNVNQVRTLSDGCKVEVSAIGAAKTFTTGKPQAQDLLISWYNDEGELVSPVTYNADWDGDYNMYEVKLSAGSVKIPTVEAGFAASYEDKAANGDDTVWKKLQLSSADKRIYESPKLTYRVYASSGAPGENDYYTNEAGTATPCASVDKSGKIKLTGVGYIYVEAYDSVSGAYSNPLYLHITAEPTQIVGKKNVNLEVGQSIALSDLVDYKEGNKILKGALTRDVAPTKELKSQIAKDEHFVWNERTGTITAVKAGGNLTGKLEDNKLGLTTDIRVKSKPLSPVKGLKATYVINDSVTMAFNYNGSASAVKVDVTDSSGKTVKSSIYSSDDFNDNFMDEDKDYSTSSYTTYCYYDSKAKKTWYAFIIDDLAKQSGYNVTVTALYSHDNGTVYESSKPVKKSVKTTKMPAASGYLNAGEYGGIGISYWTASGYKCEDKYSLYNNSSLGSGNTYILAADSSYDLELQEYAKDAATDSLTWKSTNNKVASVKANSGSFTATLKAVKAGTTTIEVTSKTTKKVIARYRISINAVGSADNYFGENERQQRLQNVTNSFIRTTAASVGRTTAEKVSAVAYSLTEEIKGNGKGNTYTFTAPADGIYSFRTVGNSNTYGTLFDADGVKLASADGGGEGANFCFDYQLSEGQTVSVNVREWTFGSFSTTLHISAVQAE